MPAPKVVDFIRPGMLHSGVLVRCWLVSFIIALGGITLLHAAPPTRYSYHQMALELPTDGGGMLMYSRMWRMNKFFEVGVSAGGGVIEKEFDVERSYGSPLKAKSRAMVLPFIGPRATAIFGVIGLSVGYGVFYADTDLDVEWPGVGKLSGNTSGWGTGFYSTLLEISFYNPRWNTAFGLGLGGFMGTSYPDLEARSSMARVTTTEDPLTTLTFHLSMTWVGAGGRNKGGRDTDDDF